MKSFWKWMEKKKYDEHFWIKDTANIDIQLLGAKQMLIGYMIEYLMTKHDDLGFDDLMSVCPWDLRGIDNVYLFLEIEIKNLEV